MSRCKLLSVMFLLLSLFTILAIEITLFFFPSTILIIVVIALWVLYLIFQEILWWRYVVQGDLHEVSVIEEGKSDRRSDGFPT